MGMFNNKNTNDSEDKIKEGEKSMKDLYTESENKIDAKNAGGKIAYRVLIKPAITEKATELGALNQYVFIVAINANKIDVAKAIYEVYGVKPVSVNMIKSKGKVITRGRVKGRRKDFKKAIVTLKKGETISIYEGV
jgi:large subunit ribosomal protein L23